MSLKSWVGRIPYIVSLIVFGMGCLVLLGWCFDFPLLKAGLWPSVTTVKVNTAICLILAGSILALLIRDLDLQNSNHYPNQSVAHSTAAQVAIATGALLIMLVGALTVIEYGVGWNLGIDQLLFTDSVSSATPHPGRMAPNTAVQFVLIGAALLLFQQQRPLGVRLAQLLTLAAAAVALQSIVGYLYQVRVLYQPSTQSSSIALPTAVTLLVLCSGMLFLYPEQGVMQSFTTSLDGGLIARKLLPAATLLPLILGWALVWGYRMGYYEPEFAISLLVVLLVVTQAILIWESVNLLNRNDAKRRRLEAIRQQTEAELRESETRFRQITESIDDMFWMADAQTQQIIYVSPQYEKILGRSRETLKRGWRDWIEAIHPEDWAHVQDSCFPKPLPHQYDVEYRIVRSDGSIRWVRDRGYPVYDSTGAVQYVSGIAEDITERKQLEAKLRLSEVRFRCLYDANIIGIVVANFTGDILEANDAFLQMVGYSRTDLTNRAVSWLNMTPAEYLPLDQRTIEQVRRTGSSPIYEKEYIRKDGSRVSVLLGVTLLPDVPEKAICFILDLTEWKQAESALRESETRFRYMADAAPMLVWMSGVDRQCNYFNQAWLNFTGRTQEQELGYGWVEGIHPDDCHRCITTYTTAFDARQPFEMEYRLRRVDGSYHWLLDIGVPRFTPTGNFLGYIGSCLDIHDRKQAEADMRRINEILELHVKERTAQLEVANKELESFSYSVSHDLRAPLRHIAGFVGLLQKRLDLTQLDATSQRYLAIIAETTHQAGTLIDELLSFSRMGRSEMRSMQVNLQQMVQEIQQELEPDIAQRQIDWQIDVLPTVQGDPSMLRLVLRNLIENAVKYTRLRPQAVIHIGSLSREAEDVVFVRDNGIGFNMQYAHKLFGIFQRLHSDPDYEGTGIGLANVRRIIHRHGGKTWAEAAPNQGATFYFSLPQQLIASSSQTSVEL